MTSLFEAYFRAHHEKGPKALIDRRLPLELPRGQTDERHDFFAVFLPNTGWIVEARVKPACRIIV